MSIEIADLEYLRAGYQKVADCGQYGRIFYIFRYGDKIMATNNRNNGVGELIETITARTPEPAAVAPGAHGLNRADAPDYSPQYESTGKL